jgi:hypothetical protein
MARFAVFTLFVSLLAGTFAAPVYRRAAFTEQAYVFLSASNVKQILNDLLLVTRISRSLTVLVVTLKLRLMRSSSVCTSIYTSYCRFLIVCFHVDPFNNVDLTTISSDTLDAIDTMREAAESAETDEFDPQIDAASGTSFRWSYANNTDLATGATGTCKML